MMELCPSGPLYLELGNGIQSVLERLSQKSTSRATSGIDSVVLRGRYCRFIDTHVSPEEIADVLRMASCLPNLRQLCLLRLRVPVTAITSCLPLLTQLTRLEWRSVCLSGTLEEVQALADTLKSHTSITHLSLADCRPSGGSCDRLDALVEALGDMPALQHVELDMMELNRWCQSVESFRYFLRHSTRHKLTQLSLSYMRLPHEYIETLAQELTASHAGSLQQLYLDRCDSLRPQSVWAMAQMLRHNTSLKELHLVVKQYEDAIPIAHALQENARHSQLHTLLLRTYHQPRIVTPAVYQAILEMLQENCRLTKLELYQGHPMRPLDLVLEEDNDNHDKEGATTSCSLLEFYLKLNRAGRAKLLLAQETNTTTTTSDNISISPTHDNTTHDDHDNHNDNKGATNEQWVHTIIAARGDIDCSFYFLSQNPTVCQINR